MEPLLRFLDDCSVMRRHFKCKNCEKMSGADLPAFVANPESTYKDECVVNVENDRPKGKDAAMDCSVVSTKIRSDYVPVPLQSQAKKANHAQIRRCWRERQPAGCILWQFKAVKCKCAHTEVRGVVKMLACKHSKIVTTTPKSKKQKEERGKNFTYINSKYYSVVHNLRRR